jgi:RNA polymerase sigma-70 factor (ECF subfamily)
MGTIIVEFPPSFASQAAALPGRGGMRPVAVTDDALLRAIGAGDRSAMRVLFARHKDRVFRFILRMVRDRALADDLLNDVFLVVWQRATSFAGRSSVSTWLLGIARHKALTALAARRTEPLDHEADIVDPAPDPEDALAGKQRAALLRRAIHSLSPTHREIVDLVYDQGRSIAEIAELLHIPANTVKTRMFYARQHLAAFLRNGGGVATPTTVIRACRPHRGMETS